MTSLLQKACLLPPRQLIVQQKRFRGKINIQKPRAPHYERAKVMKFVEPFYFSEKRGKPLEELCGKVRQGWERKKIVNPLQQIIAREALNWFNNSRMIAFFHMNPFPTEERFNFAVALKKHNMHSKFYGKNTISMAVQDTPYQAVLTLFSSQNLIVFGQDAKVQALLKIIRKRPELVLMAGVIDGKLLNKNEFVNYAKLGDLTAVRSGLVQVLQNAGGVNLNRQLSHHQSTLVSRLQQISSPELSEENME